MSLPLSNIRVVDLGLYVAGPFASIPLIDFGADVIKIEPLGGDPNRGIWRAFACANRGKRSICLDLKKQEAVDIALELCGSADIVQHNYRPGVPERMGLGFDEIKKRNPDLIMLELSAYGSSGPMADQPGFDMIMQALCGHEALCGGKGNAPAWLLWAPVDFTGGYLGAIASLSALFARIRGGDGGKVHTSLLNSGMYLLSELVRKANGQFEGVEPINGAQTGSHPARSLYQTADDWIAVVALSQDQADALISALGLDELIRSPLLEWSEKEADLIGERLSAMPTDKALQRLRDSGVWAEVCRRDFDKTLFENEAWRESGIIADHPHPDFGSVKQIGNLVKLSDDEESPDTAGMVPTPGQHTRELLAEIGKSDSDIDALYERGIVA